MNFHLLTLLFISTQLFSQTTTITLTPSRHLYHSTHTNIIDSFNVNLPHIDDMAALSLDENFQRDGRTLFDFDLENALPDNAFILSASLDLYANPTPTVSSGHINGLSGFNSCQLTRVLVPWEEMESTWHLPGYSTTANTVILQPSISSDEDYLDINMTTLVRNMVNPHSQNNGLLFSRIDYDLANESAMNFAGGNHPDIESRPQLEIEYTMATCTNLRVGDEGSYDLYISSYPGLESENLNHIEDVAALCGTEVGTPYQGRTLLKFNIESIPSSAKIVGATLDLFDNPTPEVSNWHNNLEYNGTEILKVSQPWDETTTSWQTQPTIDSENGVRQTALLHKRGSTLDIDLTDFVKDAHQNPESDFGFMLRLLVESDTRAINYSGTIDNRSLRPTLKVCYEPLSSTNSLDQPDLSISVHPIPSSDLLSIDYSIEKDSEVSIINTNGQKVKQFMLNKGNQLRYDLDVSELLSGTYQLVIKTGTKIVTKKIIVTH